MDEQYKAALAEHLRKQGWTAEELAWADENPHIRQAQRSFLAGWMARTKTLEAE